MSKNIPSTSDSLIQGIKDFLGIDYHSPKIKKTMSKSEFVQLHYNDLIEAERKWIEEIMPKELFVKVRCCNCGKALSMKRSKYCSTKCREEAQKKQRMTECPNCKKIYEKIGNRKYCSEKCKKEYLKIIEENKVYKKVKCPNCNKMFEKRKNQKFCSVKCRTESYEQNKPKTKTFKCAECGKVAERRANAIYCGKKCTTKAYRRRCKERKEVYEKQTAAKS